MKRSLSWWAWVLVLAMGVQARAGDSDWETVATGKVLVKTRSPPGSAVNEVYAEAVLNASPYDIQRALSTTARIREYMPYVKDNREISETLPDNSIYIYTMFDAPVVGRRDYVIRNWLLETAAPGGTGNFRTRWEATPDYLPERHGIIRLKVNRGTWDVTPVGDGSTSRVRYTVLADPGGWIPAFAVNAANRRAALDTYAAVEKEAQRWTKVRQAEEAKKAREAKTGGSSLADNAPKAPVVQ